MLLTVAFILLLGIFGVFGIGEAGSEPPLSAPICNASTFQHPQLGQRVQILSVSTTLQLNYTTPVRIQGLASTDSLSFCQVKVYLTHQGSNDSVLVEVWLPLDREEWNGRFQATGGGGFAAGLFDAMLGPAIKNGYAASTTDGGHESKRLDDLSWALSPDRTIDWGLLLNLASRSVVEQVIVGKSITEQFFGVKPRYSYWNGCSEGGRQGYVLAQKYPHLLDGILAAAPAISMVDVAMADYWPHLAMKEAGVLMSRCEFDFFRQKAMEECDMLDGVSDGVISDPDICDFDPLHVIGQTAHCDGKAVEITKPMAEVVRQIERGPRTPFKTPIHHGFPYGTSSRLADITISSEGDRAPNPFPVSSNFIKILLLRDPSYNVSRITYSDYVALWAHASYSYGWMFDTDEPDLSTLFSSGTKLLTWHGINDALISYLNIVRYRERVERIMGGAAEVDKHYRLFLAPGVDHCGGGTGPVPKDPLSALVDWVEQGEAPETLETSTRNSDGDLVTRDLCAWPGKPKYMGVGDPKRASSWSCIGGTERPEVEYAPIFEEVFVNLASGSDHQDSIPVQGTKEKRRTGEILGGLKDRLQGLNMGLRIG